MTSRILFVLLIASLLSPANQTLSRSDRKSRAPRDTCTPGDPVCDKAARVPLSLDTTVVDRNLVQVQVSYESILRNHKAYSRAHTGIKSFSMATTLAFVTPWNRKGYETTVTFAQKFSHVSPTWLQVSPAGELIGREDVNRKWLRKLMKANPEVRVVPRLIFHEWTPGQFDAFLSNQQRCLQLVSDVISLLKEAGLHGVVLELWKQMPSSAFSFFLEFLRALSEGFRAEEFYLSLVVPPTSPDPEAPPEGSFNSSHFSLTGPLLDSVVLTTYDYPLITKRPGPSAPLPWMEACVQVRLIRRQTRSFQLCSAILFLDAVP